MNQLRIKTLADAASVSVDTIRYYEKQGLLPEPERGENGYRLYSPVAIEQLRFIKKSQSLGFSLNEIKHLMTISAKADGDMAEVKALTDSKIATVKEKVEELNELLGQLQQLSAACEGEGSLEDCPIWSCLTNTAKPNGTSSNGQN